MPAAMTLLKLDPDTMLQFCKTGQGSSPSRILKLTNTTQGQVAFKVKTTAPKAYLVRPSAGVVGPNGQQEVQIILQPQGIEGQPNNHRFLVQAVASSSAEPLSRDEWADLAKGNPTTKTGKNALQEQRLSVEVENQEERQEERPGGMPPARSFEANAPERVNLTANSANAPASELKVKYDEIVQYTLMLEKEKKKMANELASAKQRVPKVSSSDSPQITSTILLGVAFGVFAVSFYSMKFLL